MAGFARVSRVPTMNVRRCLRRPDGNGLMLLKGVSTIDGEGPLPRWICEVNSLTVKRRIPHRSNKARFVLGPLDVACMAPDGRIICARSSGVYRYSRDWVDEELMVSGGRSRFFFLTAGTNCVYGLWGPFRIARIPMNGPEVEVICRTRSVPHCFAAYRAKGEAFDRLIVVLDMSPGMRSVAMWDEGSGWKEIGTLGDCAAASIDINQQRPVAYVLAYIKKSGHWALWVVDLQDKPTCLGPFPMPHRRSAAPTAWHRVFARPQGGVWITGAGNDERLKATRRSSRNDDEVWAMPCGKMRGAAKLPTFGLERCFGRQICDGFSPLSRRGSIDGEWIDTWEAVFI
ncbi:hypothetical protein FOL47_002412 [Perkinsus chesapeaki]|uniref:Uncharacterized protein n=1 Tax=Perkinsus chesapeaki TaxID=330153 RepID=A0A7J6ME28_PERCH|nr:hypothetical protein FOL47_002412 [Perkinsus chesapeaki]